MNLTPLKESVLKYLKTISRANLAAMAIALCQVEGVRSQPIVPDSTLGAETSVMGNGVVDSNAVKLIEGGATRGENLFHSFSDFNVGAGEAVYFANPINIENILSRVTGDSLSTIDGVLGVDGSANLFLLNPNGLVFGPEAVLDIAGSFSASTAGSLRFSQGDEFSAITPEQSLLSVSVPLGLQLNTQPQGNLTNAAVLSVGQGETLTLMGNQVSSNVYFSASDGIAQILGNQIKLVDRAMPTNLSPDDNTNISFQSTDRITINDATDNTIRFLEGLGDISLAADIDADGVGDIVMADRQDTLQTNGRNLTLSGNNIILGSLDTTVFGYVVDIDQGGFIPAFGTASTAAGTASFSFSVPEGLADIEDLDVRFSAEHTYVGDLEIILTSPVGTIATLFRNVGGSGQNFQDTVLNDEASTSIFSGSAPFIGEFRPETSLDVFDGQSSAGEWTLLVTDTFVFADDGMLYRAGNSAPWGIVEGTQLLVNSPQSINTSQPRESGNISIVGQGNITTGNINSSALLSIDSGNGGDISISSVSGDISIGDVTAASLSSSQSAGSGGTLNIIAEAGNVTTGNLSTSSSILDGFFGNVGNGGEVSIVSGTGNVLTGNIDASSNVESGSGGGNGGNIQIIADEGSIQAGQLLANASTRFSNNFNSVDFIPFSLEPGDITLRSRDQITSAGISASSRAVEGGPTSRGGDVQISSVSGDITINGEINSDSLASEGIPDDGGSITISSIDGNITVDDQLDSSSISFFAPGKRGGDISISSGAGDITLNGGVNSSSFVATTIFPSDPESFSQGGDIRVSSLSGNITMGGSFNSFASSDSSFSGRGGDIFLLARNGQVRGLNTQLNTFSAASNEGAASGTSGA
ncbi:MAG: filamentous hemagglutinin N-terminal domain-containing protein, partial [Cyanobacteria bacterium J06649_4]